MRISNAGEFARHVRTLLDDQVDRNDRENIQFSDLLLYGSLVSAVSTVCNEYPLVSSYDFGEDFINSDGKIPLLEIKLDEESIPEVDKRNELKNMMNVLEMWDVEAGKAYEPLSRTSRCQFMEYNYRLYELCPGDNQACKFQIGKKPTGDVRLTYTYAYEIDDWDPGVGAWFGDDEATPPIASKPLNLLLQHQVPIVYLAASYCLDTASLRTAYIGQWKGRSQSGTPSDNPLRDMARTFRELALGILRNAAKGKLSVI